jgi:hypothetical protein
MEVQIINFHVKELALELLLEPGEKYEIPVYLIDSCGLPPTVYTYNFIVTYSLLGITGGGIIIIYEISLCKELWLSNIAVSFDSVNFIHWMVTGLAPASN